MDTAVCNSQNRFATNEANKWFDGIVDSIKSDHLKLASGIASKEDQEYYDAAMQENPYTFVSKLRQDTSRFFIEKILFSFVKEIQTRNLNLKKLAFSYDNASVLCWAVIHDGDEDAEDGLILSKAKVNAEFTEVGFSISLTVLESSDPVKIPAHYNNLIEE